MRRSRIREEEEYEDESGEYESGEYESDTGEFEEEPPRRYARRSSTGPVFAISLIILSFMAVLLAYYFLIYMPERAPLYLPERATPQQSEEDKRPDAEAMFQKAEDLATEKPGAYAEIIAKFEEVAKELDGTEHGEIAAARAKELKKEWAKAAEEALAEAKKKSDELVRQDDFDAAVAAAKEIPENLSIPVAEQIEARVAEIDAAARERIESLFNGAGELFGKDDFAGVYEVLDKALGVKYAPAGDLSGRANELKKRIADVKWERKEAGVQEVRERRESFLGEFDSLLANGKYENARSRAGQAAEGEEVTAVAEAMKSGREIAAFLQKRVDTVRDAKVDWVGKEVVLQTAGGEKKGIVRRFDDKAIDLEIVFKTAEAVGSMKETIGIAALQEGELDRLLPPPVPATPGEWLAESIVLRDKKKYKAAADAIGKAAGHPLAGHYTYKLEVETLGAAEASARNLWRERVEPLLAAGSFSPDEADGARRIVEQFRSLYGETKFAGTVGAKLERIDKKVTDVLGAPAPPKAEEEASEEPAGEAPAEEPAEEEAAPDEADEADE